ncbi:hypothetical protein ACFYZ8_34290 [Streptomyces sp. NPDC001668]|uniref:hypothetical protein n=1 Tax=Streptomyces sp. NPDC001668 TaxID=3364598 RepID=UPI0036A17964
MSRRLRLAPDPQAPATERMHPLDFHDTLDLPDVGRISLHVTTLDHGHVRYAVRGSHLRGSFVLIPEALTDGTVLPSTVTVQYGAGEGSPSDLQYDRVHRPEEPVVFNARLHGWTNHINPDAPPGSYFLGPYAHILRNGVHRPVTDGVRRRTETLLRAIARHWARLPHRQELITSAARCKAAELAEHEAGKAAALEEEAAALVIRRAQARRRVNVLNGIIRRRPLPIRPADPAPVRVPITDAKGGSLGVITVREISVDAEVAGSVVYEVSGTSRVQGRFTVERNRMRPQPMPEGIHVAYGHARSRFTYEHELPPSVNGVTLSGGWDCDDCADITATTPAELPAQLRAGGSAPAATQRRASAVLRALALRYLARPDAEALRLAAAKEYAPGLLGATRLELREMRARQREAERQAALHREREKQYRALL